MGIFSRLFGGDRKETTVQKETIVQKAITPQKDMIVKILDKYAPTRDFNSIINELDNIHPDNLALDSKENWYFFRGVSEMNLGNRDKALEVFKTGLDQCPDSQRILFSIGQEYEYKNDKENAIKYFSQVKYTRQVADLFNRIIHYYYLMGEYELGLNAIQPILDRIYQYGVIDDTFLYMRELPFFGQIYPVKIVFTYLSRGDVDKNEFQKYKERFGSSDLEKMENLIKALVDKNYQPIIDTLNGIVDRIKDDKTSALFLQLQIALFQNKVEDDLTEGLKRIESINITNNSFSWLNDVKMLGKAELYSRFGETQTEYEVLNLYFENQPLMFESNISVDFGFVDYQEKIKSTCIDRKTNLDNK